MDTGDWRSQMDPNVRQRIVNKIMDILKRHLPLSCHEIDKIKENVARFEEKTFVAARSQEDYMRKISLKIITIKSRFLSPLPTATSMSSDNSGNNTEHLNQDSTQRSMDTDDWRSQLNPAARERIINKIVDTLKMHLPFSDQEVGLEELKKIVARFEEQIFVAATTQENYLQKIAEKMHFMESQDLRHSPNDTTSDNPCNVTKRPNQDDYICTMQGRSLGSHYQLIKLQLLEQPHN